MGEIKRTEDYFDEMNLCVEGYCDLCDTPCELEEPIPRRKGNTVNIHVSRDFSNPERVYVVHNSVSRKVTLRDVVALLRAAAMLMEYVILNRMPEDGIAKRFHDALYGVIKEAYTKPKDAEVILGCLNRMLEAREDEVDGK